MKASRPMLASDDERKYSLRIDYGAQCRMRSFFGLSKKLFAFVVAVVLVLLLLIILLVVFLTKSPNEGEKARIHCPEWKNDTKYPLILISMDGFRPDYLDRNITPNINYLARNGVRAKFLRPQFPTKTFPNHYSIVTNNGG